MWQTSLSVCPHLASMHLGMQHMHQSMLADPPSFGIKSLVRDDHNSMVDLPDLDQQVISHVSLSYLQVQSGPAANGPAT